MRNSWRLLLLRNACRRRSPGIISTCSSHFHYQPSVPDLQALRSFSSLQRLIFPNLNVPRSLVSRNFSTEVAVEQEDPDHAIIVDAFSQPRDSNDVMKELELKNVVISHELVLKVLASLESSPDVARRFFDWVSECHGERLSSKSYNLMLSILGLNGFIKEFWNLVEIMKKKGYGVSKGVRYRMQEKFVEEGLGADIEKLKGVFASGSVDNSTEKVCARICKIIRKDVWDDNVESQLRNLNFIFTSKSVEMILENLGTEPLKALIFFRWIEEGSLFGHDERTYNAMARVLGREDCIDRFWKVIDEMRSAGCEMEMETYAKVLGRFCKRKMIKEAVELYEYAMAGAKKPSAHCCTFLLKKIAVSKDLDISLLSRVAKTFTGCGKAISDSMLNAVLKSLTSVGRFRECNKVLKAIGEVGFVPSAAAQSRIAYQLSSTGRKDEASEFIDNMEASEHIPDHKAWGSLIEGYCVARDVEKASDCLRKAVEKESISSAGYCIQLLVNAYCNQNRASDAYILLHDMVTEKQLKPWHSTYKVLISKLLVCGGFKDALNLLGLMRNHGFPPFVEPFVEHVSKSGTSDDAISLMKAMTSHRFPSRSVFLHMFEAFFKARRYNEAQDFLSKCPGYIRNHADVLNLFCSINSGNGATVSAVAA